MSRAPRQRLSLGTGSRNTVGKDGSFPLTEHQSSPVTSHPHWAGMRSCPEMSEWQQDHSAERQWSDREPSLPCVVIDLHSVLMDFYDEPEIRHKGTPGLLVAH